MVHRATTPAVWRRVVRVSDGEEADERGEVGARPDALVTTLLGVFPDERVLSSRERILHERPTRHGVTQPSWHAYSLYGIWTIPWGAFREREGRSSRGDDSGAARRRSAARRAGRLR